MFKYNYTIAYMHNCAYINIVFMKKKNFSIDLNKIMYIICGKQGG